MSYISSALLTFPIDYMTYCILISTLHPYTCFFQFSCTYCYWYWLPYYGKVDTSDSGFVSVILWVFLTLHVGEIPIYDLWWGDSQLVPVPHIATQKASVGMYVIITTILVCALFGTAIPTSSFNFCYNCSFLITLWAINIYHLAFHSMLNSTVIGQDYVWFCSLSCTLILVWHCLWITLLMCQLNVVCLEEFLKFKLIIVSLLDIIHCSGNMKSMA